ncbi:PTS sugar transporter subunit IIA [Candidatus Auribacterota bacterium]
MSAYHRSYKLIQVSKMLRKNRIVEIKASAKDDVLKEMVSVMATSRHVLDKDGLEKAIFDRENLLTTGIGIGIAIPHAKTDAVDDFIIAVGRKKGGLMYESMDGGLVYLVIMIAAPASQYTKYLNVHAKIVLLMANAEFRQGLINAESTDEIRRLLRGK